MKYHLSNTFPLKVYFCAVQGVGGGVIIPQNRMTKACMETCYKKPLTPSVGGIMLKTEGKSYIFEGIHISVLSFMCHPSTQRPVRESGV